MTSSEMRKPSRLRVASIVVITLPFTIVVVLFSPIYLGLQRLLGWCGVWQQRRWRTVDVIGDEITFGWSCSTEAEARDAIASAISMLVDLIPSSCAGAEVESIRFVNPETGMALDRSCLQRITADFGDEAARLLPGNHVECGVILANNDLRLENLNLDARSPLTGHFSVDLSVELAPEDFTALASQHRFQVGLVEPTAG